MAITRISPQNLVPGTVVTVQMRGLFALGHHFALVTGKKGADGRLIVIANSGDTEGPAEQIWDSFCTRP
jgi:hypothetical protein